MSRVGKKPIAIPKDVKVSVSAAGVSVQGPKGQLVTPVPPGIRFSVENGQLLCERSNEQCVRMTHQHPQRLAPHVRAVGANTNFAHAPYPPPRVRRSISYVEMHRQRLDRRVQDRNWTRRHPR